MGFFFNMVLNHEDYISMKAYSKKISRADVHHVLRKAENKLNGRFPNSGFAQISRVWLCPHLLKDCSKFSVVSKKVRCKRIVEAKKTWT